MTCATPTFSFKRDRHRKSQMIGKLVTAIHEKLSTQLIFDPSQSLQQQFVSGTFANRNRNKPIPRSRFDQIDEGLLIGPIRF